MLINFVILKGVTALAAAVFLVLTSRLFVHMLQQEGYKIKGLFFWLLKNFKKAYALTGIGALALILLQILTNLFLHTSALAFWIAQIVLSLAFIGLFVLAFFKLRIANAKKPLAYTPRVKRLFAAISFVSLVFAAGLAALDIFVVGNTVVFGIFLYFALVLQGDAVILAAALMTPVENGIKKWYFNDAKRKLAQRTDIIKIGITGSYGKTSTKFILGTLLSKKYAVLLTPSSFNTPMGLTRVIREQLNDSHEVFIAEMGARHVGDIAELTGLVHPTIGIITSVGPQHLETFKSLENIKNTKYELIDALPKDGTAFFNGDNEICRELFQKTKIDGKLYGMDYAGELYAKASDIETGPFGSRFTLLFADGTEVKASTRLLGRHNILNITGCAAIARALGLTAEQIANGIAEIEPVEHRLQIIPTNNGMTIIDDAFNSNPQGVKMAMDVLAEFPGRRIVITPGMVELGAKEAEENNKFGRIMAKAANIVFLIGEKHTKPIYDGLIFEGFDTQSVYVYNTLEEAMAKLGQISRAGDVVIFENDLPDNYNE